jgi:hypothetical protein
MVLGSGADDSVCDLHLIADRQMPALPWITETAVTQVGSQRERERGWFVIDPYQSSMRR